MSFENVKLHDKIIVVDGSRERLVPVERVTAKLFEAGGRMFRKSNGVAVAANRFGTRTFARLPTAENLESVKAAALAAERASAERRRAEEICAHPTRQMLSLIIARAERLEYTPVGELDEIEADVRRALEILTGLVDGTRSKGIQAAVR